ncbi:hypothetical protein [Rhizosphaericola mali]|uniref:Oligosaccharide repeat unit polymerase n=1 Tax=Rhizosphaericola mali TaxID=2545455 RepID=A0A5P2G076_9BACT|nr:hypothetical protein [Rhizosphaericola mali]QES89196.1 hypothetical protein E0W69_011155 [Rhizosphaericola mali]
MDVDFFKRITVVPYYQRLILWILVFIQFYPLDFVFLPVSSRVVISFLGLILLVVKILANIMKGKEILINKGIIQLAIPLLFISLISIISLNYNGTNDKQFLVYFSTSVLMLSSGFFTFSYAKFIYGEDLSFEIIAYYCIGVVLFQLILGISMYFNTELRFFLLNKTRDGLGQLNRKEAGRFMGFGAFFMNLGVANGVGLFLIAILLKNAILYKINFKLRIYLSFLFIFIFILGMFQARTTLICGLIAMCFWSFSSLQPKWQYWKDGLFRILKIALGGVILLITTATLFPEFVASQTGTLNYGFELFYSASEGKGLQTGSSNLLSWMLTIWPTSSKSWLIGDGMYSTSTGNFYMRTDVGYARLLFYFGIFGMLSFYVYEIMVIWKSFYKITKFYLPFFIYFLVMVLFVNLKSFTEFTHYLALFFMFNIHKKDAELKLNTSQI